MGKQKYILNMVCKAQNKADRVGDLVRVFFERNVWSVFALKRFDFIWYDLVEVFKENSQSNNTKQIDTLKV